MIGSPSSPEIENVLPASAQESEDSSVSSIETRVDIEPKEPEESPKNPLTVAIEILQAKLALVGSEEIVEDIEIDFEVEMKSLREICQQNSDKGDVDAWYNLGLFLYNVQVQNLNELALEAFNKVSEKSTFYGNAKQFLASNAFGSATDNPTADSYGEALQQAIKAPQIDVEHFQRIAQRIIKFYHKNNDARKKTVLLGETYFVPPEFIACVSTHASNEDLIKSFQFLEEMTSAPPTSNLSMELVTAAAKAPLLFSQPIPVSADATNAEPSEEPARKKFRIAPGEEK